MIVFTTKKIVILPSILSVSTGIVVAIGLKEVTLLTIDAFSDINVISGGILICLRERVKDLLMKLGHILNFEDKLTRFGILMI